MRTAGTRLAVAAVAVLALLMLGYGGGGSPTYALAGAVLILAAGVVAVDLTILPMLAFPCMLILTRVGGGTGLSVSDLVLFLATLCALLLLRTRESPELRSLLWLVVVYQAALIPTLIRNPYQANFVEWAHELVLVGGSLIVGWVVGRRGRGGRAVGWYVMACTVLAVLAMAAAPGDHFQPVYLSVSSQLTFQKNALGDLLAFAVVVCYARPDWLGWTARRANLAIVLCLGGILATQSKQAIISLAVGIAVVVVRRRALGRRSRAMVIAMVPLVVVAYVVTANQLASSNRFNAAHQRLTWYSDSIQVWHLGEWFGIGLRWWYTARFSGAFQFQPPNAEFEMLTSAGLVGLAAFMLTSAAALALLWRIDPRFGTLGFALVAARLTQGQVDLYWVASQSSAPWLIVGVALGAQSMCRYRDDAVVLEAEVDVQLDEPPLPRDPAGHGTQGEAQGSRCQSGIAGEVRAGGVNVSKPVMTRSE